MAAIWSRQVRKRDFCEALPGIEMRSANHLFRTGYGQVGKENKDRDRHFELQITRQVEHGSVFSTKVVKGNQKVLLTAHSES